MVLGAPKRVEWQDRRIIPVNNKLTDLKKALDDELITEEEYKKQPRAVIEGIVEKYAER